MNEESGTWTLVVKHISLSSISEELFVPVPKVDVSFCDIRFPNLECWAAGEGGEAGGQRKPV